MVTKRYIKFTDIAAEVEAARASLVAAVVASLEDVSSSCLYLLSVASLAYSVLRLSDRVLCCNYRCGVEGDGGGKESSKNVEKMIDGGVQRIISGSVGMGNAKAPENSIHSKAPPTPQTNNDYAKGNQLHSSLCRLHGHKTAKRVKGLSTGFKNDPLEIVAGKNKEGLFSLQGPSSGAFKNQKQTAGCKCFSSFIETIV